jgi:hypothetical protein
MILVVKYPGQGIAEDGECFLKLNPRLAEVLRSLGRVPLKMHALILSLQSPEVYLLFRLTRISPVPVSIRRARRRRAGPAAV